MSDSNLGKEWQAGSKTLNEKPPVEIAKIDWQDGATNVGPVMYACIDSVSPQDLVKLGGELEAHGIVYTCRARNSTGETVIQTKNAVEAVKIHDIITTHAKKTVQNHFWQTGHKDSTGNFYFTQIEHGSDQEKELAKSLKILGIGAKRAIRSGDNPIQAADVTGDNATKLEAIIPNLKQPASLPERTVFPG